MRVETVLGALVVALCYVTLQVEGQRPSGLSVRPRCGPMCRMRCQFGFVTDHLGCPICRCRPGPGPSPISRCPRNSRPVSPRRSCTMFSIRPRRCGAGAFCSPTPMDGPGICCRRNRPVPTPIGQCPRSNRISTCQFTADNCLSDRECRRGERCCPDGCGSVCKPVRTFPSGGYPRW